MKNWLARSLVFAGFLLLWGADAIFYDPPLAAQCQSTTIVTGTVTDPNGIAYALGTVTADLFPSGGTPTCTPSSGGTNLQFSTHVGPTQLDKNGSFTMALPPNAIIQPGGTQWTFTVAISPGGLLPLGTGPQSFQVTVTIAGASQSVSAALSAAAPALSNIVGTGSGCIPAGANGDLQMKSGTTCAAAPINASGGVISLTNPIGVSASQNVALTPVTADAVQFVSTAGNNSNNGFSWGGAKLTIAGAETALPAGGGTIYVASGTFTGTIALSKPTQLVCNGNGAPTTLTIANATNAAAISITASNTRITGCLIDGNRAGQTTGGAGVTIGTDLTNVTVDRNTIRNTFNEGVAIPNGSTNVTISQNSFTNNNQSLASTYAVKYTEASGASNSGLSITNNSFNEGTPNTGCIAVVAPAGGALTEQTQITGNNCLPGSSGSYSTDGVFINGLAGSPDGVVSGITISSNVVFNISNNLGNGIRTAGDINDIVISGNTIALTGTRCIFVNNVGTSFNGEDYSISNNSCDATGAVELQGTGNIKASVDGNTFSLSDPAQVFLADATSGVLRGIIVSNNNFDAGGASLPNQRAIYFSTGINDSIISGNSIFTTAGAAQTQPAIVLTSSSNNLVEGNNVSGYTGAGNGAIGILISNAGAISNRLGVNNFGSVTTPYSDSGTTTQVAPQTAVGPITAGHCANWATGLPNPTLGDAGAACGAGGGGVTSITIAGTANQITATGTCTVTTTGTCTLSLPNAVTLGAVAGGTGAITFAGNTSGTESISGQAATGGAGFLFAESGGLGAQLALTEGTAGTLSTGQDDCYADSTIHGIKCAYNGNSYQPLPLLSGTVTNGHCTQIQSSILLIDSGAGCGPGTGTQFGMAYWATTTTLGTTAAPAVNGQYTCGYSVVGGVAVAPTCPLVGLGGRAIIGATTTDTILYSDNSTVVEHDQSASGTVAETLPTATTLGNAAMAFSYANHSAQTDTITPTTWTIQKGTAAAGASISVAPGVTCRIKVDTNSATNWLADCFLDSSLSASGTVSNCSTVGGMAFYAGAGTTVSCLATVVESTGKITLGTDNSVAGSVQVANGASNAHTIWGSAATTSNTINGFATAPTTTDIIICVVASTTCTLTDSGIAVASSKIAISAVGTAGLSGTAPITISAAGAIACATCQLTSGTIPINQVVSATGAIATIADGNNPLTINCALTSGTTCLTTGETTAATTAGAVEHQITTLTTSTAIALQLTQGANGPANAAAPNIINVSAAAAGGLASASNAGSTGAGYSFPSGAGSAGGATTGNGGNGGSWTSTLGAGGASGGTATNNGGNGGGFAYTTGAGGNGGSGAGTAGSGGAVTFTLGAPGTNSATGTAGAVGTFTITGNAPASTANATGVAAGTLVNVAGVAGGASSNAAGTGGVGSIVSINAGVGGAGTGTNAVGGAGGNINLTAANGGASSGTGVNSNGGNIVATPGAAGTGGSGTAGKAGVFQVAGPNAGFVGFQQGAANTLVNTQIPANTAVFQAPAAVTAYFADIPGAAPVNNNSTMIFTNANPAIGSFAKTQVTAMLTSQYTNSTTSFTNVTGGNNLAFAIDASTTYQGTCVLYYQAAATGGLNIEFTGPASPTFVTYSLDVPIALGTTNDSVATAFSTSLGSIVTTAATNFAARVTFGISNGVNAGTLQLLAKSSAAVQLQIQTGSYCTLQ